MQIVLESSLLLLTIVCSFIPCVGQNAPAPTRRLASNQAPPDSIIVLQHGACERRCAVFRIAIFDDGTVIFHGMSYVRRWGVVLSNVQTGVVRELIDEAKTMDFFALKNGYGVSSDYDMSNDFQVSDEKCHSTEDDAPIGYRGYLLGNI